MIDLGCGRIGPFGSSEVVMESPWELVHLAAVAAVVVAALAVAVAVAVAAAAAGVSHR